MAGGALEYIAILSGYRFLLIMVAGLYLLAWLFATRFRRLADRELAQGDAEPWKPEAGMEEAAAT
jgi:hypothetical protein